jgi:hypothetical protein
MYCVYRIFCIALAIQNFTSFSMDTPTETRSSTEMTRRSSALQKEGWSRAQKMTALCHFSLSCGAVAASALYTKILPQEAKKLWAWSIAATAATTFSARLLGLFFNYQNTTSEHPKIPLIKAYSCLFAALALPTALSVGILKLSRP